MTYIGAPPTPFVIPVTLGADREFTANRVDGSGNPINWNATVHMSIDIDRAAPTVINATVTNNQAALVLPAAVCDQVKNGTTRWRLYMTTAGPITTPVAVGYFERDDGGKPTQ